MGTYLKTSKFHYFVLAFSLLALSVSSWSKDSSLQKSRLNLSLQESDAIVHGRFISSSFKKLPTGEVVTVKTFDVLKISNQLAKSANRLRQGKFYLIVPGGKWAGVSYQMDMSIDFKAAEEVVIFAKKSRYGYRLSGAHDRSIMRKEHSRWGTTERYTFGDQSSLSLLELDTHIAGRFGYGLKEIPTDFHIHKGEVRSQRYPSSRKGTAGRSIASIEDESVAHNSDAENKFYYWWGVIILGVMGGLYRIVSKEY
jgi:hypothetical protein